MSQPTSNFNIAPSNPTFSDALNLLKRDVMLSLNCHAIATVQSFDSTAQTIRATISYSQSDLVKDAAGLYVQQQTEYPILVDCPVIVLGGGAGSLTFPIAAGDQCLILFNDRSIDNWFAGARSGPVSSTRVHSFSDGLALVGLNKVSFETGKVSLVNGDTQVVLGTLIRLANNANTLGSILTDIVGLSEAIVNLLVTLGVITPLQAVPILAQIASVNGEIGGLLE